MHTRSLLALLLLLVLALPACASEKSQDASIERSIKQYADATDQAVRLNRSIPVQVSDQYFGKLEVYGPNLDAPPRLRLILQLPNSLLINDYYFKNGLLARAITRRYFGVTTAPHPQVTPASSYDVYFNDDQIIGRRSTGDPADLDHIEPLFPNRTTIDQFLANTRAASIFVNLPPDPAAAPAYPMD